MNGERLEAMLERLRGSLWFIPALMTTGAVLLAIATVSIDQTLTAKMPRVWFLFSASAEGARAILSTIAGSIITVTGVVFSITIVALQLASSQYTPRVLRTFIDDRATQMVLGTFIATFTYSLLVLRGVRSEMDEVTRFVPGVSITMAVLLTLASIGALIFFVNHIARSIRVEAVMNRITNEVLERIDVLFPRNPADPDRADSPQDSPPRKEPGEISFPIRARRGGYLQHVEDDQLLRLAKNHDLIIQMTVPVGSFLLEGDDLAFVAAREGLDESTEESIRETFHIGFERTLYQDVVRGTVELTDIALRALSPSLNDPTTAIGAIDHLTRILHRLAGRRFPSPNRRDENGRLRVIAALRSFDEMVRLPLSQLRHAGAGHPSVAHRLIHAVTRVAEAAPPDRIPPLLAEMEALAQSIREETSNPLDLSRLEKEAQTAVVALRRRLIAAEVAQHRPADRGGLEPGAP